MPWLVDVYPALPCPRRHHQCHHPGSQHFIGTDVVCVLAFACSSPPASSGVVVADGTGFSPGAVCAGGGIRGRLPRARGGDLMARGKHPSPRRGDITVVRTAHSLSLTDHVPVG